MHIFVAGLFKTSRTKRTKLLGVSQSYGLYFIIANGQDIFLILIMHFMPISDPSLKKYTLGWQNEDEV